MAQQQLVYQANPTLAQFHLSDADFRGVMGPVGSGKSSAMCIELVRRARAQQPDKQGRRRTRWAVVRNSYPELKSTTVKTWQEWVPDSIAPVVFSSPIRCHLKQQLDDTTTLDMEVLFLALDKPADIDKVLSMDLTGAWLNEARQIPRAIVDILPSRYRFPPPKDFRDEGGAERQGVETGATWMGTLADTNPPDTDHWWYKLAEEERPPGWDWFRQPPAVLKRDGVWVPNDAAENLCNLPPGYYAKQLIAKRDDWIKVYLANQYGWCTEGASVWSEFSDTLHVAASPLSPIPGVPIQLGWDFGLTPSCVATQLSPRGVLHVLHEWTSESIGISGFSRSVVKPDLVKLYPRWEIRSCGDPAGKERAQTDERSCFDELTAAGLPTVGARSNNFVARREAVAAFLTRLIDGKPGFLLDPSCRMIRKGMSGGYYVQRVRVSSAPDDERLKDEPVKNQYSHPCEALQYASLALDVHTQRPRAPISIKAISARGWL